VDASDPEADKLRETTEGVLKEIGAGDKPTVLAFNKIDLVADRTALDFFAHRFPDAVSCPSRPGRAFRIS
jgi:GTP-binding protein HflX